MPDNTIHLDIHGLSEEEVGAVTEAAAALGADLEALSVTQNAEEFLQHAPVMLTALSPFVKMAAEAAAPRLAAFLRRALGRRRRRTIHLTDLRLYLEWDDVTEQHAAAAIEAMRALDPTPLAEDSVLYFDVATGQWRPR